ncbi:MAG: sigma-54-dependent Fis family transcriptional regulator [candidate division NC10 bacterium]|nr:sigma-54-dependent Fis family transcriptional regulator [candidate division NC10 bacterium]
MAVRVLVADDDPVACDLLQEVLAKEGYEVEAVTAGQEALELGKQKPFDVALLDVWMPDLDGLEVLRVLKAFSPDTIVIMMTAFGSIETAIEAIKEGAYDYVSKPFKLEEIKLTISRALERRRLVFENLRFKQELKEKYRFENIVGSSERMLEVYKVVARVAPTKSTVLIQGETGTGKELITRAIHYNSPRADRPFVAIDCSALAESLLESELFGHVKGAFTGAMAAKRGLFEEAHGGTCFLDEVGEINQSMQAKLLRVLQEHEVKRVGGTESVKVDVRVIAATNKDLEKLVADGKFREDLFYRLSVVTISLPPLRERREDIPLLASHFLRKYAAENNRPISHISPEAMALLTEHDWPGNVRELQHVIERAVALTANPVLLPEDLPRKFRRGCEEGASVEGSSLTLRELEKRHIQRVLKQAGGNKKLAAELLGIHRRTLYRLAERYGIDLGGQE